MGIIFSWFKKPSTKELLQEIQDELDNIQGTQRDVEARTRRVGRYVVYTFVLYLLIGLLSYWYWLPRTLHDRLIYAIPFAAFPPIVMLVKKLLHMYYGRQLRNSRGRVEVLQKRKQDILDQVMDTETYKVAKEILQRYAPEQLTPGLKSGVISTPSISTPRASGDTTLRRRDVPTITRPNTPQPMRPVGPTPIRAPTSTPIRGGFVPSTPTRPGQQILYTPRPQVRPTRPPAGSALGPVVGARSLTGIQPSASPGAGPPGVPMPRPVAPRERGLMDRLIDYMMKEGPSNSYALVCRHCETHNGMALQEDFPYMAYRCAYCHYWNPARKQRPAPPQLEKLPDVPPPPPADESDESETGSETSSEDEKMEVEEGSPKDQEKSDGASSKEEDNESRTNNSDEQSKPADPKESAT